MGDLCANKRLVNVPRLVKFVISLYPWQDSTGVGVNKPFS